jgi:uncharacterized protein with PIN domain
MSYATFHFYDELNYFLPLHRRHTTFTHTFEGRVSIKDMIESFGVPHTEIEAISANGRSVDLTYLVDDAARIEVFGFSSRNPVEKLIRPPLEGEPRFILDVHLGQLAVYLRMLGFDALYRNDYGDEKISHISSLERRVLLSRDRGIFKRSLVEYGYFVREVKPKLQIAEVVKRFDLQESFKPLKRCIRCNGPLKPAPKEEVLERLAPLTARYFDEFSRCLACGQIYWKGSHYSKMLDFIADLP